MDRFPGTRPPCERTNLLIRIDPSWSWKGMTNCQAREPSSSHASIGLRRLLTSASIVVFYQSKHGIKSFKPLNREQKFQLFTNNKSTYKNGYLEENISSLHFWRHNFFAWNCQEPRLQTLALKISASTPGNEGGGWDIVSPFLLPNSNKIMKGEEFSPPYMWADTLNAKHRRLIKAF